MKINPAIGALSFFYWINETAYFGWNMFPNSPEEMICDGITVILFSMAIIKGGS